MAQRTFQTTGKGKRAHQYVNGNVAYDYDVVAEMNTEAVSEEYIEIRQKKQRSNVMNLPYLLFLTVALVVSSYTLIHYIQLRSEVTYAIRVNSNLESELNSVRMSNDEAKKKIDSEIDLDEIKEIATKKLGMVYAKEGQVITYSGEGNDYVKQSAKLH